MTKIKIIKKKLLIGGILVMSTILSGKPGVTGEVVPFNVKAASTDVSNKLTQEWDKVFPKSNKVNHRKVTFKNRFGITITADMYIPKNTGNKKLPALVLSGPFGAVKEQSSGLYAQTMAERGFVTLAFDPSFTGESGGSTRNIASPEIFTEDFSAAVDYLVSDKNVTNVDTDKIGVLAICGLSGMGITAASADSRIKAVAVSAMYDMSRSISKGYQDYYTREQQQKIVDYMSEQRTKDAKNGNFAAGPHEISFDEKGNVITGEHGLPEILPENPNPVLKRFFDYYRTTRAYHPRSINSNTAWTATTPYSFFAFNLMDNINLIAPRPIMLVTGTKAHSRYYSEDVYKAIKSDKKELVAVEGADHVDLYDNLNLIPFDKLEKFFKNNLK